MNEDHIPVTPCNRDNVWRFLSAVNRAHPVGELGDQILQAFAFDGRFLQVAADKINPIEPAKVNKHFALAVHEDKPWIAFIGYPAINLCRNTRLR